MEVWSGQVGSERLHDFHPPVPASGLFWTMPIPVDSLRVDPELASASLHLTDIAVPDFDRDADGRLTGAFVPATVSMTIEWMAAMGDATTHPPAIGEGFAGEYRGCAATIEWSALTETGFRYTSDPAATSTTWFAQLGRERTGHFAVAASLDAAGAPPRGRQ